MHLDESNLSEYLVALGVLEPDARTEVEKPGEGNINFVRRVRSAKGPSFVVKQARETLERFPEYRVSRQRILYEWRYASALSRFAAEEAELLPRIEHFDPEAYAIVMEDLGPAPTLEACLLRGERPRVVVRRLGRFLARVDQATRPLAPNLAPEFDNREMRELHGEHVFRLPFEPNDFPVPEPVRAAADRALSGDLLERIARARRRYYDATTSLVHGDVQGTNILLQGERPRLVDAEIAHFGDPGFDLGVLRAHIEVHALAGPGNSAAGKMISWLLEAHEEAGGDPEVRAWSGTYAGIELLRRTLGAARFEFIRGDRDSVALVQSACGQIASGPTL